jgi:hypothetical protein
MESLSEEAQATQAGSTRDYTEASQSASESSPSKKRFSIQILYLNCLQALRAVTIMSIDKDRPNVIYSHLVVGGVVYFRLQLPWILSSRKTMLNQLLPSKDI